MQISPFTPYYNGNGEFAKNGRKKSSKSFQTYCLCAAALNKLSVTRNITNNATNENTVNSKNFLYIHAFCDINKLQIVLRYLTFIVIEDDGII